MSEMEKQEARAILKERLQDEQIQKEIKQEKKKENKRKRKGFIVGLLILALGGIAAVVSLFAPKKQDKTNTKTPTTIENVDDIDIDNVSLEDLGVEEEVVNEEKSNYGKTTGNVDKDKIVEKDGTIWKDKEAASKSDQVGKTKYDTKGDKLVVKDNGKVYDKEIKYEVKDETGKVVDKGSNSTGVPDGYVWDKDLNKYVPKDEVGKYVYADATYYATDGSIAIKKGDKVLKTTLEKAKKIFSTTKPSKNNGTKPNTNTQKPSTNTPDKSENTQKPSTETNKKEETTTEVTQDEGKVNKDGTYTIYGMTYMDKATFQSFVLDENSSENFGLYNGVIYPKSVINEMSAQNQKTK